MKTKYLYLGALSLAIGFSSCKKDEDDTTPTTDATANQILADFGAKVALPTYDNLNTKAVELKIRVETLRTTPTQANLVAAQNQWFAVRTAWEQSECMLFGPVDTEGLDPAIDTWPVSQVEVDSLLNTSTVFTDVVVDGLGDGLKGFHPMEYLLFGVAKTRNVSDLNVRQLDYLVALATNLASKTEAMHHGWMATGGNYTATLSTAGSGNATYPTKQDAVLEVANAIIGIVDEVGHAKIEKPLAAQNPLLEESPFAINSWKDFSDNITGAKNAYMGAILGNTSTSLHDFVLKHNASLDVQIQQKFDAAITNLSNYSTPFGQSIINQKTQVQATQAALSALQTQMEDDLIPLIQLHVKD